MSLSVKRRTAAVFLCAMWMAAPALAAIEGRFDRTLAVTGPVTLSATSGSGGIEINAGQDGSVHVVGVIRGSSWSPGGSAEEIDRAVREIEARPPIVQQGNQVRIGELEDERIGRLVSISFTITVPRQTGVSTNTESGSQTIAALAGPVTIASGSGAITVGRIENAVQVRTGSGSIKVEGAGHGVAAETGSGSIRIGAVTGDTRVKTGSGSIDVQHVSAPSAQVSSGSGHIRIAALDGGVTADTASASIEIAGNPTAGWRATTSSGSITLAIPGGTPFKLQARTQSGSIRTDHTLQTSATGKHELEGTVGGGGALVEARSSSGSINVTRR